MPPERALIYQRLGAAHCPAGAASGEAKLVIREVASCEETRDMLMLLEIFVRHAECDLDALVGQLAAHVDVPRGSEALRPF